MEQHYRTAPDMMGQHYQQPHYQQPHYEQPHYEQPYYEQPHPETAPYQQPQRLDGTGVRPFVNPSLDDEKELDPSVQIPEFGQDFEKRYHFIRFFQRIRSKQKTHVTTLVTGAIKPLAANDWGTNRGSCDCFLCLGPPLGPCRLEFLLNEGADPAATGKYCASVDQSFEKHSSKSIVRSKTQKQHKEGSSSKHHHTIRMIKIHY